MKIKNTTRKSNSKKRLVVITGTILVLAAIAVLVYWLTLGKDTQQGSDQQATTQSTESDKEDVTGGSASDTPVTPADKNTDKPVQKKDVVPVISSYAVASNKKAVLVAALVTGLVEDTAECTITIAWSNGNRDVTTTAQPGPNSMSCTEASLSLEGIPNGEVVTISAKYTSDAFAGSSSNNPQITIGSGQ